MTKIEGGFSTKDPESMKKLLTAIVDKGNIKLPFTATGWTSERNSHLVTGKKAETSVPKEMKEERPSKEVEKKVVKEVRKKEPKKKEVKIRSKSGDTKGSDIRGSPLGTKKKTSRHWLKSKE